MALSLFIQCDVVDLLSPLFSVLFCPAMIWFVMYVKFDYDYGVGSKVNRFSIDLYRADGGSGDCGTYVTSICDKESVGCRDSGGLTRQKIPVDSFAISMSRFFVQPNTQTKLFSPHCITEVHSN